MQIDFTHRDKTAFFKARMVWQVLFNEYRKHGGNLDDMGDMLCDLKHMAELFQREVNFCWSFQGSLTSINEYAEYENVYWVKGDNVVTIERLTSQ